MYKSTIFHLVILVQLDILDGTLFLIILYCNKRRFLLTSAPLLT